MKIAHASSDENKNYKNGQAGDQRQTTTNGNDTQGEVCIREWYNRPWTHVYLPPTKSLGNKVGARAINGANNKNIGYDQNQRNTLITQLKKVDWKLASVNQPCETDCSAFATACVISAGAGKEDIMIVGGNCATSSTIGSRLVKNGWKEVVDKKYTASPDYLPKGAILVYFGHHVAIAIEDGKCVK